MFKAVNSSHDRTFPQQNQHVNLIYPQMRKMYRHIHNVSIPGHLKTDKQ